MKCKTVLSSSTWFSFHEFLPYVSIVQISFKCRLLPFNTFSCVALEDVFEKGHRIEKEDGDKINVLGKW